jgi:hypothetical protein
VAMFTLGFAVNVRKFLNSSTVSFCPVRNSKITQIAQFLFRRC